MSNDIKRRISEHNCPSEIKLVCDRAINKYGRVIEIELLEVVKDLSLMAKKEMEWIRVLGSTNREIGYNISNGGIGASFGEQNHQSVFSNAEVYNIRKRRARGERKIEVYQDYCDRKFNSFEGVWLGRGYVDIGVEYMIPTNTYTRQEHSSKANSGENNNRAKLTKDEVLNIRNRYDNGESPNTIAKNYPFVTLKSIRRVCRRETWKSVK